MWQLCGVLLIIFITVKSDVLYNNMEPVDGRIFVAILGPDNKDLFCLSSAREDILTPQRQSFSEVSVPRSVDRTGCYIFISPACLKKTKLAPKAMPEARHA